MRGGLTEGMFHLFEGDFSQSHFFFELLCRFSFLLHALQLRHVAEVLDEVTEVVLLLLRCGCAGKGRGGGEMGVWSWRLCCGC